MSGKKHLCVVVIAFLVVASIGVVIAAWMKDDDFSAEFLAELADAPQAKAFKIAEPRISPDLLPPVRLQADGQPINIGKLSSIAHAGPWIADVDQDGDRDLVVGDFPGYFWLFENNGSEEKPEYTIEGKLQAGGEDAKTPVY